MSKVELYTDGACRGNPGAGGYGIVLLSGTHRKELSAGYQATTNNRMELIAAIEGLKALKKRCSVRLFSDSRYLVESMNQGWVLRWKARGWKGKENVDLWNEILRLCEEHEVEFIWVKGHASNVENNRCDELAVAASKGVALLTDKGFENRLKREVSQGSLL